MSCDIIQDERVKTIHFPTSYMTCDSAFLTLKITKNPPKKGLKILKVNYTHESKNYVQFVTSIAMISFIN